MNITIKIISFFTDDISVVVKLYFELLVEFLLCALTCECDGINAAKLQLRRHSSQIRYAGPGEFHASEIKWFLRAGACAWTTFWKRKARFRPHDWTFSDRRLTVIIGWEFIFIGRVGGEGGSLDYWLPIWGVAGANWFCFRFGGAEG